VNGVVADLREAEYAFNLGQEKWQFQRKIGMLVACLNEMQELFPNQILQRVGESETPLYLTGRFALGDPSPMKVCR
jgi:hypothetical protein